jgi:hypothetical protein
MLIYSTVGPAGIGLGHREGTSPMRVMKPIMAIAAICATMMTMRVVMRSKKASGKRKRRGMMRQGR